MAGPVRRSYDPGVQAPAGGWSRTARAAVFACVAVALGAVAHTLGEAMAPSRVVAGAAVAVVFVGARAAAGRERSLAALTGAMLAVQAALHVAFMLLPARTGPASGSLVAGLPLQRLCGGAVMRTPGVVGLRGSHLLAAGTPSSIALLAAHTAAALVLAWCLRCGEAAVWSLARLPARVVLQVLRLLGPRPGPTVPDVPARAVRGVRRLSSCLLRCGLALRGPPLPAQLLPV